MNTLAVFMQRFWALGGVLTGLAVLGLVLDAPQVDADATGAEPVSASQLNLGYGGVGADIPIPASLLTHSIKGDGRRITSESAVYRVVPSLAGLLKGKVCNWQIAFSYKENGKEYLRESGQPVPAAMASSNPSQSRRSRKQSGMGRPAPSYGSTASSGPLSATTSCDNGEGFKRKHGKPWRTQRGGSAVASPFRRLAGGGILNAPGAEGPT